MRLSALADSPSSPARKRRSVGQLPLSRRTSLAYTRLAKSYLPAKSAND